MNIVYFYQYFSTPKGSWGTRVYEFAKEWVAEGHNVTVVSSIYSKSDLTAERLIEDQTFDGINVKVINVKVDNKQTILKRIWSFLKYSIISSYYALTLPADIVIASSGPITIGIPGLLSHYIRGRKLVFEARDLWPEGAIELKVIKNPIIIKLSYWFEKVCYSAASYIVTLSPGMTQNIKDRFKIKKVDDVTNAANINLFSTPIAFDSKDVAAQSYAIYTGNIGVVNNSEWLYEAAKELQRRGRQDIKILLIGDGQQREELASRAEKEYVTNFIILGLMPKINLVSYVQNSMASLVPLKDTPVLNTSSPNKFFESLAAGIPIIQNTNGWMKDFLDTHSVGYTLDPNDPKELADLLIEIKDNPHLKPTKERCMEVAKTYFDKNYLAKKMLNILEKVHHEK